MKNYPLIPILFIAAIGGGCASPVATSPANSQNPTSIAPSTKEKQTVVWTKSKASQKEIAMVMAGVRNKLRDPESARFEGVYALNGSNGVRHYCGYVNAKNGFGGYTGKSQFLFMDSDSIMMADFKPFAPLFPKICEPGTVTR